MIEFAVSAVEKLLMRFDAVVTFFIFEGLHYQIQPVQILHELRFGRLILFIFLQIHKWKRRLNEFDCFFFAKRLHEHIKRVNIISTQLIQTIRKEFLHEDDKSANSLIYRNYNIMFITNCVASYATNRLDPHSLQMIAKCIKCSINCNFHLTSMTMARIMNVCADSFNVVTNDTTINFASDYSVIMIDSDNDKEQTENKLPTIRLWLFGFESTSFM